MTGCKHTKWTGLYGLVHHISFVKHLEKAKLNHRNTPYMQRPDFVLLLKKVVLMLNFK